MKTFKVACMLIFVGILSACSKKTDFSDDEKLDGKVRVTFTVDGFEQELVSFPKPQSASAQKGIFSETPGSSSTDIRDHINVLDIYVFHTTNPTAIDYVRQYADDPEFGTYENYFDPEIYKGNLYVSFHGTKLNEEESVEWTHVNGTGSIGVRTLPEVVDAFSTYKITKLSGSIESNIKLSRYVGRLDLNLEETIPDHAGYIEITIENTGKYYSPYYETGFNENREGDDPAYHTVKRIPIMPESIGSDSLDASVYFIPKVKKGSAPSPVTMIIAAYDVSGELIQEISIPNVLIQANKVTKLKGTIFTIPNFTQQISLETDWGGGFPELEF